MTVFTRGASFKNRKTGKKKEAIKERTSLQSWRSTREGGRLPKLEPNVERKVHARSAADRLEGLEQLAAWWRSLNKGGGG